MTARLTPVVLTTVLVAAGGCAAKGGSAAPQPLWQRTFLSTAVTEHGQPRPLVAGTRIRLTFDNGRVQAHAGCNQLAGQARVDGDRLVVSQVMSTDMACGPEGQQQDAWLSSFLTAGPNWQLDGDHLTLRTVQAELRLTDRRSVDPDRPLVGTRWTVESILGGQQTSSIPAGVTAYLTFDPNGRVTGSTGCNTLSASARRDGDTVTFDAVTVTKRACDGDAARVESAVLAALTGRAAIHIAADTLTITQPDGHGLGLRATG
ncbi:META domain-containing protein [Planosporangium thailandense]|uniref:META domain-containing protein n=1 Tax=Planosporangium thailandense TaxID=765197 RepID=A0ABX0XSS7_9ACTN|nr:META domain-containing protein [Planosporangium thailandense]NJC69062.1 META domain-containing protein [Planosporangium thailandense]